MRLPEPSQFKDLVANVRKRSGGWGPRDGDLVEFWRTADAYPIRGGLGDRRGH